MVIGPDCMERSGTASTIFVKSHDSYFVRIGQQPMKSIRRILSNIEGDI